MLRHNSIFTPISRYVSKHVLGLPGLAFHAVDALFSPIFASWALTQPTPSQQAIQLTKRRRRPVWTVTMDTCHVTYLPGRQRFTVLYVDYDGIIPGRANPGIFLRQSVLILTEDASTVWRNILPENEVALTGAALVASLPSGDGHAFTFSGTFPVNNPSRDLIRKGILRHVSLLSIAYKTWFMLA